MRLQPITRKERFLYEIVGWGETAPEKPATPEEFFFAAILGEAVQAPEPLTRYQMYLAKIAGREIEIPYPKVRLEYFLAKAAGMEIETPTPITREEIYWSNYSAIVDFEVEGVPPLTFKSNGANLSNYRIYGNTVNGESVGDLVQSGEHSGEYAVQVKISGKNILKSVYTSQTINGVSFSVNADGSVTVSGTPEQSKITYFDLSTNFNSSEFVGCELYGFYDGKQTHSINANATFRASLSNRVAKQDFLADGTPISDNGNGLLLSIRVPANYSGNPVTLYPMIVKQTISDKSYEQYREPATAEIYLSSQLSKLADVADYIDYATQKRYNADGTSQSVELPTLQTVEGANTLSVGTTVQPSKVTIKGRIGSTNKVTYYDSDGTFLSAEDVKDGTNAQGFTPTKASTAQYDYTFMGWSTTKGSTTAETGVLNDITADKSLYAVFSQSLKTFTVYFYNGSTLLQTAENVQYGGTATYTGEAPTKDGFTFSGWQPSNVNITADTSCYAQFVEG